MIAGAITPVIKSAAAGLLAPRGTLVLMDSEDDASGQLSPEKGAEEDSFVCMMCGLNVGPYSTQPADCPRCGESHFHTARYRIEMRMSTPGRIGRKNKLDESARVQRRSEETGHVVGIHRIIDRRADIYYERVVDQETGEELRHVEEPLSEHVGRGSARRRADDPEPSRDVREMSARQRETTRNDR